MIKIFVLSVSAGLESVAKKEIEKQGGKIIETVDRLITFEGTFEIAAKVNIWSRVGNKVYMLLGEEENIEDFDDLYGLVNTIDFKKLIPESSPIIVKATSLRSELHHTPTLQSITKKSIIDKLLNSPLLDKRGVGGEL
jgi:putative N6-adenine-specific DNA methylase